MEIFKLIATLGPEIFKLVIGVVKAIQSGDKKAASTLAREAAERQSLFTTGKIILAKNAKKDTK